MVLCLWVVEKTSVTGLACSVEILGDRTNNCKDRLPWGKAAGVHLIVSRTHAPDHARPDPTRERPVRPLPRALGAQPPRLVHLRLLCRVRYRRRGAAPRADPRT